MRSRSAAGKSAGIAVIGPQKMLASAVGVTMSRSCGTILATAGRGSVMPRDMPVRISAMAPSAQRGNSRTRFEEAVVVLHGPERLRAAAGAVHGQVHGQAAHLVERHVFLVKLLPGQRLLALGDEDLASVMRDAGDSRAASMSRARSRKARSMPKAFSRNPGLVDSSSRSS